MRDADFLGLRLRRVQDNIGFGQCQRVDRAHRVIFPLVLPAPDHSAAAAFGDVYLLCRLWPASVPLIARVDTCAYDVSSLAAPMLTFGLNRTAQNVGQLRVYQEDAAGGFTILLGTFTGTAAALGWQPVNLPFTPLGDTARFRFEYEASQPNSNIAIDFVWVH